MLQTPINLENEYVPDVVSAPGDTLQEMLEERQMTQTELAERLGMAQKTVNEIIRGKAALTHETALGLETVLGVPASFWNTYESAYRESITRREVTQKLYEYVSWLKEIPWKKAAEKGWIDEFPHSTIDQLMAILRFFGVASPKQYGEVYGSLAVQWKRSEKYPIDEGATAIWLRQGEIEAAKLLRDPDLEWHDYDQREFEKCLVEIRPLTRDREPSSFVVELQRRCAKVGVAVVFVPDIGKVRAAGATRWLSPSRALILLSLRHMTNDALWFCFYHEAGHIIKHSKKRLFLDLEKDKTEDDQEREADEFAQNLLISPRDYLALEKMGRPTKAGVEEFARKIGVDPGIVVGRLEKENILKYGSFNDLKQQYKW